MDGLTQPLNVSVLDGHCQGVMLERNDEDTRVLEESPCGQTPLEICTPFYLNLPLCTRP